MRPLILLFCLLLSGCAGSNLGRPKIPALFNSSVLLYSQAEFQKDYAAYKAAVVACSKPTALEACTAKALRDSIINRIRFDIERNYREYESSLFLGRAGYNTSLDALQLGLSTAATLSGAEFTKTVLSAILTGVQGVRLSIDKNFLGDKTVPIIIAKMQVLRSGIADEIETKMALQIADYPLESAWIDLEDLFWSGTLVGGVQALMADAGQAATEMKTQRAIRLRERVK